MKRKQQSPRTIRILGAVGALAGTVLIFAMAWLVHWLSGLIGGTEPGSHWRGGPQFTRDTFGLFYSVMALGGCSGAAGVFMAASGRRQPLLTGLVLACMLPIFWFCSRIYTTAPPR